MRISTAMIRLLGFVVICTLTSAARDSKSMGHLSRCIHMAEPLVRDPKYIFPLTVQDIKDVCRMWEEFIDCVYQYANTYMAITQQQDFNKTIKSNIEIIQQLCTGDPEYHKIYMAYAPCMKRVSIEDSHCGNQYRYLTDLVQAGSVIDGKLCCAHRKFRECVLDTTAVECDAGGVLMGAGNTPSQFMKDMLDQTMGFLLQRCKGFEPNAKDCPNSIMVARAGNSPRGSNNNSKDNADTHIKSFNDRSPVSEGVSGTPEHSALPDTTNRFGTTSKPRQGNSRAIGTAGNGGLSAGISAGEADISVGTAEGETQGGVRPMTTSPTRVGTPAVHLGGGGLMGPASSQQYKDAAERIGGSSASLILLLIVSLLTAFLFNL